MAADSSIADALLTPKQVAARFSVSPKTIGRWGDRGVLRPVRTSGGHRRFRTSDVDALVTSLAPLAAAPEPSKEVGEG